MFVVLVIIAVLAIPLALVWIVVDIRSDYEQQVSREISAGWGGRQILMGPFLKVQVRLPTSADPNEMDSEEQFAGYFFTPETLNIASSSEHQIRHKGIFKKPVFSNNIEMTGTYAPDHAKFAERLHVESLNIERCSMILTVQNTQSIRSLVGTVGDRVLEFEPSPQRVAWGGEAVRAPVTEDECKQADFSLSLSLRGSNLQSVAMLGDETELHMSSTWPHPKFEGRQLPDSHDISETGFTANWSSIALARGFASMLNEQEWFAINRNHVVGFAYFEPVTLYSMVIRAVKYGFFVVGLTMLAILCVEFVTQAKVHLLQYGIVGAGLALFYLLLLSFAEHIGFIWAYIAASIGLTTLIVGYAWFSTKQAKFSTTVGALLVGIYVALYVCLSSTDYALLIGSILLVILLASLMYATRGIAASMR